MSELDSMTAEKPKKTPLKAASSNAKTGSSKPASKSLKASPKTKASPETKASLKIKASPKTKASPEIKASPRKAKSIEKDWQGDASLEKSPLKKVAAKKRVPKVVLSDQQAETGAPPSEAQRTSEVLKALLDNNSDEWFTVEQICAGLGTSSFGVSLLAFSIPEVVPIPIPGISAIVALPTAVVSSQMIAGKKELLLPKRHLRRKVPRKALYAAIHAVLPALRRIEKGAKPRGRWVSNPLTQRLLGIFIFVLALFIALPIPATNMPPAIAIFVTSLGMVERDGLLICAGILIGLASMVLIGALALGSFSLLSGLF